MGIFPGRSREFILVRTPLSRRKWIGKISQKILPIGNLNNPQLFVVPFAGAAESRGESLVVGLSDTGQPGK
jgi:hypothetical protein